VSDLTATHYPRVVAPDLAEALEFLAGELSAPHRDALRQSHGRFAVVVENAGNLIWDSSDVLGGLGIVVFPLHQLESDVERFLITGVDPEISPGLCPLTDMLRSVVRDYRIREFDWLPRCSAAGRRTLIMGILNTTPDSFSDGGRFFDSARALDHAREMIDEGADIIDVGGCSTRPGAAEPSLEEEIRRTASVISKLRAASGGPISIDTYRAEVARRALDAGADVINDVTAFAHDPDMSILAASRNVPVILMHMQGTPRTMQENPRYDDLVAEIYRFLSRAVRRAEAAGVRRERIAVDPGFGFGKTVEHNLEILRRLHEFRSLGRPVVIGTSRKSAVGKVLDRPTEERLMGTAATVALAVASGASIVRVHDVAAMRDVARMTEAVLTRRASPGT
jgi:dihydropteroate synthase